ncbi:LysR family transcriptional regulator [Usitatibacter palustris]|uniref:PCP degradation transcriptional activation protein n=1 Tax=Usitatibacter palustris TaxID=2732487 RepID=A0A6M4H4Q0_9PROT|nr:LysR family transcriptional regulator [Usitatibacter palustris]QJR14619.1 PCP degradation transcriptional activation protein [Usitatibacter palustris]
MKHEIGTLGRRVDLNLLVIFDAVYQARSLTEAGIRLGLSQPAISHALGRLRHVFGDPLFLRTPRGVAPTQVADQVAPRVAEGLSIIRSSFEPPRFDPATSTRLFTIGMADIGEVVQLPLLMKALRNAPGIRLRTIALPPTQARAALADGQVDLALSNFPVKAPLHEEILGKPGYATIVRRDHPTLRSRITLAAFRRARHLLVRPAGAGVRHGEVIEKALRAIDATIAIQVGHFFPVGAILAKTDLVATVPLGIAKSMARLVPLGIFRPPIKLPVTHLSLVWHERYHGDPGNQWLREIFVRETRPLYEQGP